MVYLVLNSAFSFGLNYPEFPDSCLGLKLPFIIDVDQVLVHCLDRDRACPARS